jgi:hypothetical protein
MKLNFDEWWDGTAPTATPDTYKGWEESCRQAWAAGSEAEGVVVLKTMLEVFDIMANPTQFRSALAAAVAKRTPSNA